MTASQPPVIPHANASVAGATPKEMTSASESSSRPSADDVWRQRAIRPSRTSKANAAGAKAAAMRRSPTSRLPR
jgi:hypothetical protein